MDTLRLSQLFRDADVRRAFERAEQKQGFAWLVSARRPRGLGFCSNAVRPLSPAPAFAEAELA